MNNVELKIKNIVEELKKYNPKKVILFGSRAMGDFKNNSDIDIAVDINLDYREIRKLKEKIDVISGLYSIDLVFINEIEDDFRKKIIKEGKVLYAKE